MGFLQRLFGLEKPNPESAGTPSTATQATESIPPERMGLHGEYDQSGLAKRVAAALDDDPQVDDIHTLYVAQTGGTVVLKGSVPSQQILQHVAAVARGVHGATAVDTSQVTANA
ncbi:BON domain-containing protein [Anthocerotibacter panamensis]|uniref:BON domain-containing protein n=1 Tax=Anthocerotibacter panamensis TaxID=2857077 RepID=UPI001C407F09|nr:BON domain-containing protein [Anthocerotibacter panamensis]